MQIRVVTRLDDLPAADWDALVADRSPFLLHAFLAGMERHDCLEPHGWSAQHLVAFEGATPVAALPLYRKDNSIGEFVFDWSWADAWQRAGGSYYPKLVAAVPFTPATGPRLLIRPGRADAEALARALAARALDEARAHGLSSVHCLFPDDVDAARLEQSGWLRRTGFQYHWENAGYKHFDDFLAQLTSKRRKEVKRERRAVRDSGIAIDIVPGGASSPAQWRAFFQFYCATFERKWGEPRFTLAFFEDLAARMPDATLLILARHGSEYVAGAFAMRGAETLFGRHWGCSQFFAQLHFELCYYQTIEYCIAHGLRWLDAGAQGEHKLARGFLPRRTWSCHWLSDPGFTRAVAAFLRREDAAIDAHLDELATHSPYRTQAGNDDAA